jgi:phosphoglycerate dehydrogenase-like enzyme
MTARARPDVWIPERAPEADRARLTTLAAVHVFPPKGVLAGVELHADLLVAAYDTARALEVARRLDGLRFIQAMSAGVDGFIGRVPRGVTLCDAAGVHDVAVAEWVVMAILASRRHLPEHLDAQRRGIWGSDRLGGEDLDGATVALLGAGSIGRAVEARLAGFGATLIRVARRPREGVHQLADLPAILPNADVVVCLLPLTGETRGVLGAAVFAAMRPGALFVNASRGAVVDTDALTEAIVNGRIRAALDVTDPEPLPPGHPLWSAPGVLITPHVGGDVRHEDDRAWQLVFEQVGRLAGGEPLVNVVVDGY